MDSCTSELVISLQSVARVTGASQVVNLKPASDLALPGPESPEQPVEEHLSGGRGSSQAARNKRPSTHARLGRSLALPKPPLFVERLPREFQIAVMVEYFVEPHGFEHLHHRPLNRGELHRSSLASQARLQGDQ
jgi:hypothetical protein